MCHRTKRRFSEKQNRQAEASGCVAKERLKLMIDAQKRQLDDNTLNLIRQEIGSVITKYVDIDPENVEIKIVLKDYPPNRS